MPTKNKFMATLLLLAVIGCNPKENKMEKNKVEERLQTYFAALNRSDVDTIIGGYAPNGVFMAPDFPAFWVPIRYAKVMQEFSAR